MNAKKAAILAGVGVAATATTYLALSYLRRPPEIEFYCPICGVGPFKTYDELMTHIEVAHPGAPPVYVCMYCGKSLPSLDQLNAHIIAVHRSIWFKVAKFPGGGDPTNTIQVSTDKGIAGTVESGGVGEYREITIGLPKDATWVEITNLDGSAIELVKYPIINGIALAEGRILDHSDFFRSYGWYSPAKGERWGLNWVRLSLPPLAIPPQVTVRIEMVGWPIPMAPGGPPIPIIYKIYGSTDRTFTTDVTEIATTFLGLQNQFYPNRVYAEVTARAGAYLKFENSFGPSGLLVLKKYWRGLQLLDRPTLPPREPFVGIDFSITEIAWGWVAVCAYCGWNTLAPSYEEAMDAAIAHVKAVHPDKLTYEDVRVGEISEYWQNYLLYTGHYLIFEAVGR